MLNQDRRCAVHIAAIDASRTLRHRWVLLAALAWLLGPSAALVRGQSYLQSVGSPSFSNKLPVENGWIDASNGRLHLEIPFASYPQRAGRQYNVVLMYDSNIWTWGQPTNVSGGWSGWRLVTPESNSVGNVDQVIGYCEGRFGKYEDWNNWIWTAPDGTVRSFPQVRTDMPLDICPASDIPNSQGWASDGSGFWMAVTNYFYPSVYAPDGTLVSGSYSGLVKDSNGNFSHFGNSPPYPPLDTVGRVTVATAVNGGTTTYTMSNTQGTSTSVYTVHTGTINANTNFGKGAECSGSSNPPCTLTVVTDVVLPDGSKYIFGYDNGTTGTHWGLLTSMTLPTGGQITYSWNRYTDSQGNPYPWISKRITPDNSTGWLYTPALVTTCGAGQINCQQTFTVLKPNGDNTVYTFVLNGGAWTSEADYYTGAVSSANLIGKTSQCWNFVIITNGTCSYTVTTGSPATGIQKMAASSTLPTPTGTVSKTTRYTYDSYGNKTMIQENNWYTGNLPPTDRTTTIAYLNGTTYINALILNRPSSVIVTNSSGGLVAKTLYFYDGPALISGAVGSCPAVTGTVNHDDAAYGTGNTVRGNLTTVERLISGTTNYLTTSMTYDMTGQMRTLTDSKGNTTSYCYADNFFDDNGGNPAQTHATTTPTNAYVTTITPASSALAQTFGYYYGTGQLAKTTDPNGNSTYSHFQEFFNRLTATSLPNTGWTLVKYDLSGATPPLETGSELYTGITSPSTSGTGCSSCRHDQVVLDSPPGSGLGRVASQILVNDPDTQTSVDTTYDLNGRVKTVSNPHRTASGPTDGLETPTYDGLDRVWKVTHADGNVAYTYYGAAITSTLGQTSQQCLPTSTYGMGYPVLAVDEAGNKRETWTDGFGNVIETDEPVSGGTLTAYTCYSFDLNNNLTGVTATGGTQSRSYAYDMLSRLTAKTEPESATTYFYYTTTIGGSTLCTGDPTAVCLRKDARNITTTYAYDNMNRLVSKTYNDSSPTTPAVTYSYDQTSYNGLTITNGKGRRTGMSDGSGQTAWSYDSVGNVLAETRTINGQTKTISYTYNLDGSIYTIQYPGTRTNTYNEGNAQRMMWVKDLANSINYATSPSSGAMYAPPGGLASDIHGSTGTFTGITESYSYNNRLEVTGIQATSAAGTALYLAYSYVSGNNGNIGTQTNNVTSGRTQTYSYDSLNRLLTAQAGATSGGDCWGQSFGNGGPPSTMAADALANLFYTSSIKCSSPAPTYTMDPANNNRFIGSGQSYNAVGDMTAESGFTYTYDAENRIMTASGMTGGPYCYTYDGNGLRVAKGHGSSCPVTTPDVLYWRNIAGSTIAETDGSGSTTNASYHEYIFFAGRRIAQSIPALGSVYYYFADHLGSTRVVTTSTGSPCYEADFLPYGTENTPAGFTNTCSTNYKFTGYERDAETAYGNSSGNDYAFARYYNTRLGRLMSADPLAGDITDPQTLNHYAYVRNNSSNFTDPSGQSFWDPDSPNPYNYWDDPGPGYCSGSGGGIGAGFGAGCTSWIRAPAPPRPASQVKPPAPKPNPDCATQQAAFIGKTTDAVVKDFSLVSLVTDTWDFAKATAASTIAHGAPLVTLGVWGKMLATRGEDALRTITGGPATFAARVGAAADIAMGSGLMKIAGKVANGAVVVSGVATAAATTYDLTMRAACAGAFSGANLDMVNAVVQ